MIRIPLRLTAPALLATVLLSACSGPQEDPRVSFCRGMAADLTGTEPAAWRHRGDRIVEPEYAEVTVEDGKRSVSCFYAYDAVEPGAMEHATPLLAFATLPYEVRLGEQVLKGPALTEAVKRQQLRWNQAMLDKARQGVEQAADKVRQVVNDAADR